jgi:hypothetical protein
VRGGGTFSFDGSISGGANFSISGSVDAGGTGTARVYFFDSGGDFGITMSDNNCTVSATGDYRVEKGAIWASFTCPHMTSNDDTYLWCEAQGTFVFKSCDD